MALRLLHPEMKPLLDADALAILHERSIVDGRRLFPAAPIDDIRYLVDQGISGQTAFRTTRSARFSYRYSDGPDPMALVHVHDVPR